MKSSSALLRLRLAAVAWLTVPVLTWAQQGSGPIPGCLEVPPPGDQPRAVGDTALVWPKNILKVKFLDATPWQIAQVKRYAVDWEKPSGVTFVWEAGENADIRISFKKGVGSWSYIGTEAKNAEPGEPTMNLALTERTPEFYVKSTIRHEFGHALGLKHEHQNWTKKFTWNEPAVLAHYAKSGWTQERTVHNVLKRLNDPNNTLRATEFDPKSIMLYPISAEHTNEGFSSDWNEEISAQDKALVRELYRRDAR